MNCFLFVTFDVGYDIRNTTVHTMKTQCAMGAKDERTARKKRGGAADGKQLQEDRLNGYSR